MSVDHTRLSREMRAFDDSVEDTHLFTPAELIPHDWFITQIADDIEEVGGDATALVAAGLQAGLEIGRRYGAAEAVAWIRANSRRITGPIDAALVNKVAHEIENKFEVGESQWRRT